MRQAEPMNEKWMMALAGLVVIVAVFGLKVLHAQGVCSDMSGIWVHGDCVFDEKPVR
jgi:hypothetical protein